MNLRQLEVFQAVMQTGNMSAAARLICITPSAVSKTISHAETQLGYLLFDRSKGVLTPTPEAKVLFEASTEIHHKLDGLKRIAQNLKHVDGGQVRLAAIPAIAHEFLPQVIERFMVRHPRVGIEVRTLHHDQMVQALLTRSVDFALGYYEHPHAQLTNTCLISVPLYLAVKRDIWQRALQARSRNPMLYLASLPLIQLVGEDPMCQGIDALAEQLGSVLQNTAGLRVHTSRLALELVKRGVGWTVVDYLTARTLDASQIAAVPLPDFDLVPLQLYVANGASMGQAAKHFLDMLQGVLRDSMNPATTLQPSVDPTRHQN
jgi:DNA-binding transcriptional LysR family regulator